MVKGLVKLSVFAVLSIVGCTKTQDEGSTEDDFAKPILQLNTAELHDFAENLNWDYGVGRVITILSHPEVDRGTALMLYWRNQPGYHVKYKSAKEVPAMNRRSYQLHLEIERILLNRDFKTYDYPFNFIRESFFCQEHAERALTDTRIPQELKVMDGPNMTEYMNKWCSSDERIRAEKLRADKGYSYPYEDPYFDEKINENSE